MSKHVNTSIVEEFKDQVQNPAVGDLSWKAFFSALLILEQKSHPILDIIQQTRQTRTNLTNRHLSHLTFKAIQFLKIAEKDFRYRDFREADQWIHEINHIFAHTKKVATLKKILTQNSVTTTIYERYLGPYAILSEYFKDKSFKVADFGCGGNYGLRGVDSGEQFKQFEDLTTGEQIKRAVARKLQISQGVAMDKEDPDDPEIKSWRLACRFFPQELDGFDEVIAFEKRLQQSHHIQFIKGSILNVANIVKQKFDAIIISLVFYQLTKEEQISAVKMLRNLLEPQGILIVQDYGQVDATDKQLIDFNVSWHKKDFGFKTFLMGEKTNFEFKEILGWFDSRCASVQAGKDFKVIFKN